MAGVQEVLAGRYELLDVLGRGGMGVVYRARDRVLDRTVAVKVLPIDRAQDPTAVARFEREARAAAALSHRNIVSVFDFGTDGETRFIVMEHLPGQSLAERIHDRGPLSVDEAVDVAEQVASALAAAHEAGIVHRDIKPGNVMVNEHGHVKVLDFGIARLTSGVSLTQTATVIGSASYLAPELIGGAPADAASDVYALGCVLYELIAGRPPFTGEVAAAVLHQHSSAEPRPLVSLSPAVPAALGALVSSMLAKDRSKRPPNAAAVLHALSPFRHFGAGAGVGNARVDTAAVGSGSAVAETAVMVDRAEASTRMMRRPHSTSPGLGREARARRALALTGLLIASIIAFIVLSSGAGPAGPAAVRKHRTRQGTGTTTSGRSTSVSTGSPTPTTSTGSSTSTGGSTSTGSSPQTTSTATTVASAAAALSALAARDVQAGTVAAPAANALAGDAQAILTASQAGQGAPALAALVKLGSDVRNLTQNGQISATASPAVAAAATTLGAVLQQTVGATTQTTYGSGQAQSTGGPQAGQPLGGGPHTGQPGSRHAGDLPPGQARHGGGHGKPDG